MKGKKTGGRTAGTPNKIAVDLKEALKAILENEIELLPQLLSEMKADKRAEIISKLLPFILPKNTNLVAEIQDPITSIRLIRHSGNDSQ